MLHMNIYTYLFETCFIQFLVYKSRYDASQKDATVAHDHNRQSEIRELLIIQYVFYSNFDRDWPILLHLDLSATDAWMEKLMKKKQKNDGTLTASSSISNFNSEDDPFEEITCWFKAKRLDRTACPNPIAWWGVCVFCWLINKYLF